MNTVEAHGPDIEIEDAGFTLKPMRIVIGCFICALGNKILFGIFISYLLPWLRETEANLWFELGTVISLCLSCVIASVATQMLTWQWSVRAVSFYCASVVVVTLFEQITRSDLVSLGDYIGWPLIYVVSVICSAVLYVVFVAKYLQNT